MKIFISWSGTRSRKTAELLRRWLPLINQDFDPFVSGEDISKGGNWSQAIIEELNQSDFGIVCVTPGNQEKPWLLFEAGALSKQVDNEPTLVAPLLIGFKGKRDLPPPLGRFQTTLPDQDDMYKLVKALNATCEPNRQQPSETLKTVFHKWWDDFEMPFREIENSHPGHPAPRRSPDEIMAEVLDIVRSLQRQAASTAQAAAETTNAERTNATFKTRAASLATAAATAMNAYSEVKNFGFTMLGVGGNPRNPSQPTLKVTDQQGGVNVEARLLGLREMLQMTGINYDIELVDPVE
ncbi:hypothetical protein ASE25_05910 [Terrabacter sp. Root85]|uniref:toll/interleukin-1 receptor domain-containing protein n=1 Tax=Terrabacter sp. Root85 TaxID=1736603 RepID=UPI0006F44AC5|nr:toll/interleukin-1 receptor domain-containing protein [Terrabacter sp. Root85]KRC92829.1 hypothetical protein ASE25_05910 [Terrabacter sp. Root85]